MSGGSFNYLCHVLPEDLLNRQHDLAEMASFLAGLGYAKDAARETQELLQIVRQTEVRLETSVYRLLSVWKAAEWYVSNDWSEEQLKKALKEYRGE